MPVGINGDMIGRSEASVFIPEQWSTEIYRYRMEDLLWARYVKRINFGKKALATLFVCPKFPG